MTIHGITEPATLMAVDDNLDILNLLREILQIQGYKVLAFPNGRTALEAAAQSPPDLILLDVDMPEMNGFEVCKRIKDDDKLKEIPVLFISALAGVSDKVKAFSAGGVDYVTKPFHVEEIKARVTTHLHLRQMRLALERCNLHLEELVNDKVQEISDSQLATLLAVSKLAESRNDETGHHIERTRIFCRVLAEQLRRNPRYARSIDDTYVNNIFHTAPLHDIGKVGIVDSILLKRGRLTAGEFEIMKTHPEIGVNTLRAVRTKYPKNAFINMGIAITQAHHERWDGNGYPYGLAGEDIPLAARIMALADVYDALRSERLYKPAYSHQQSCEIILEGAGQHFDPAVITAFQAVESDFAAIRKRLDGGGGVSAHGW